MPTFTGPTGEFARYVRIDSIGVVDAPVPTDTTALYIFDQLPDWAQVVEAGKTFLGGLRLEGGYKQSVDPFGGVAEVGGVQFSVHDEVAGPLFNHTNFFWAAILGTERFNQSETAFPHTRLTVSADRNDTSFTVESTDGFPAAGPLWVGDTGNQECVLYTGLGVAPARFTGLTRGRHSSTGNSFAQDHVVWQDPDGEFQHQPLVVTRPHTFFGLRFSIYAVERFQDGRWETEAQARRLYTGFIRHVDYVPDINGFRFRCDSLFQALNREVFHQVPIHYATTLEGIYLGPRASDRTITISYGPPDGAALNTTDIVLSAEWYSSVDPIVTEINNAVNDFWSANDLTDNQLPTLRWVVNGGGKLEWNKLIGGGVNQPYFNLRKPVNLALGGFIPGTGGGVLRWFDEGPTLEASTVPPHVFFYHPPDYIGTVTARVESAEGIALTQGDGVAPNEGGCLLVGERVAFRAVARDLTVTPHTLTLRLGFDSGGRFFPDLSNFFNTGRDTVMVGDDHEPLVEALPNKSWVRQVFVPRTLTEARRLMRILHSTGTSGYNTALDVHPIGYGVGMDNDDIAESTINNLLQVGDAWASFQRMWTEPRPVKEYLQELGQLHGAAFVMVNGQLSARPAVPAPLASRSVGTIQDEDLQTENTRPPYSIGPALFRTGVVLKWNWDPIEDEFRTTATERTGAILAGAEQRNIEIESRGLRGELNGVPGLYLAQLGGWFAVFNRTQAVVRLDLSSRWAQRLLPADIVLLTLTSLHDRHGGLYGVTTRVASILSVEEKWDGGPTIEVLVFAEQRAAPLNPSAQLVTSGYDTVNNRLLLETNQFTAAPDRDVRYFEANDDILLVQSNPTNPDAPLLWRVDVFSTNEAPDYLQLTGALPAPAFDQDEEYFVTQDLYSAVDSSRYPDGTWIAASGDNRIGATRDHYPYTR